MNKQEIVLKIAELREPYSTLPKEHTGLDTVSPKGMWIYFGMGSWIPRYLDAALTFKLLEEILINHDVKIERGGNPKYSFYVFDGANWQEFMADDLPTVIAIAYIAWRESVVR